MRSHGAANTTVAKIRLGSDAAPKVAGENAVPVVGALS
jgi:hypothetical protein